MIRWLLRLFALFILVIVLAVGYYGYHIWSTAQRVYEPPTSSKSDLRSQPVDFTKDPVALLFLGVDERQGDRGRADSIIVAAINPHEKSVIMTNIPRDTLVDIPGRARRDKINHSYAYGGMELTRKTVEQFLHIPIDGTVKVNMQGLKAIVDELGGIEVDVPFSFQFDGYDFEKGRMHLNGEQALAFARMRKNDPSGDFGRIQRQQELIRAIIQKGTTLHSLTNLTDILQQLGNNIKTDIAPVQLLQLQRMIADIPENQIDSLSINGENTRINGVYYYRVTEAEQERIHDQLAQQLDWQSIEP